MTNKLPFLIILLLLPLTTVSAKSNNAINKYNVGSWVTDISPTEAEALVSCQGGYGAPFSRCSNTSILDPITVRSLSISDSDTTVIFSVIDTIGVGDSVIAEIKDKVFDLTSGAIQKESIQVSATHTHAGPDLQGLWGGVDPAYKTRIINEAALSIVLAFYTAEEAKIRAITLENGANVENRRGWPEVDKNVSVLDIASTRSKKRIATLVNMSAHPTILDESNASYSSGYAHFIRSRIENRLGGNAIFINGVLGDASPVTNGDSTYSEVRNFGTQIARNVIRNIHRSKQIKGDLSIETYNFSHPITNIPVIGAVQTGLLDMEIDAAFNINTQYSILTIGDKMSAVLFPGEILTRLATPILSEIDADYKFFFGLTDDSLGYFIPSDEYLMIPNRDTEENASIDINVGDAIQAAIIESIQN